MKVSMVVDRMDIWGGVETHVRDLSRQILDRNHEISIITGATGIASDVLEAEGVKIIECPTIIPDLRRPDLYLKSIFNVASLLKQEAPDIVHSHNIGSELPARVASRLLNIPSVHTYHGGPFGNKGLWKSKFWMGICQGISSSFNQGFTIFVSDWTRDNGLKRGYVNQHNSVRIYNGVPDVTADNVPTQSSTIKMAMVARLSREKDHFTVLEALAKLQNVDWEMTFAGKGEQAEYLEKAKSLGIEDKCIFAGEISDIPELLSRQDILIHASHQEALGIAIIEGMRASLPIIGTHVGGIPEIVNDGVNGYTFPDANVEVLTQKIETLMADEQLRRIMGQAGRNMYERSLQSDVMAEKTMEVYRRTMDIHGGQKHFPRPSFLRRGIS
ncbi:MAG: glycosyltransferase family 4 protein [Bdellovibrionales bacterium]